MQKGTKARKYSRKMEKSKSVVIECECVWFTRKKKWTLLLESKTRLIKGSALGNMNITRRNM